MTDSHVPEAVPEEDGPSFRHLSVTVHALKLVQPAEPTKDGPFYLSNIDQMLIVPVDTFFVYLPSEDRSSESVFSVLEDALGKLLVPYHFMAGRFEVDHGGKTRVIPIFFFLCFKKNKKNEFGFHNKVGLGGK